MLNALGKGSLLDPARRLALERSITSTTTWLASASAVASSLGVPPEDAEPPSPRESDLASPVSSIFGDHPNLVQSTENKPSSLDTNPSSPKLPVDNLDLDIDTSRLSAQTLSNLPDPTPNPTLPNPSTSEVPEGDLQLDINNTADFARISSEIDNLAINSESALNGIQTEMKKNRGEVALGRAEALEAFGGAKESSDRGESP